MTLSGDTGSMNVDAVLLKHAKVLIWWEDPASFSDGYIVRRIMNLGTLAMWQDLRRRFSDEELAVCLREAEPGEFSPKSWSYWHCVLRLPEVRLPERELGDVRAS